jgi:GNAT superfamily N-acetyltransferase
MEIECIKNGTELNNVLKFIKETFSVIIDFPENIYVYNYDFWIKLVNEKSNLLLFISDNDKIIASAFAWIDNNNAVMGPLCVDKNYRNKSIGKELIGEIEKRVKNLGYTSITIGSLENAEGFYMKMGYAGSLLIQSEKTSIDNLLSLNKKYKVAWTNIYDGKINQICLSLTEPDRDLQKKYEETFLGCNTQMIFQKVLE